MKKTIITIALLLSTLITFATFNISTCLAATQKPDQGVRFVQPNEGKTIVVLGTDTMTFKTVSKDTGGQLSLAEVTSLPQGGPPLHTHPWPETFYVLEGEFEFYGDKPSDTIKATAGSVVNVPSEVIHTYKNVGETPGRYLLMFEPAKFEKFFDEIGTPVADKSSIPSPSGPPDMEKILAISHKYHVEFPNLPLDEKVAQKP